MTLLIAAIFFNDVWYITIPIWTLTIAGLLLDEKWVLERWEFWTCVVTVMAVALVQTWTLEGNDYYLMFYMTIISLVAAHSKTPAAVIALNARPMIGCVFALAASWKIATLTFRSGTFFLFELLYEPRLQPFARYLGGLSEQALQQNMRAMENLDLARGFSVTLNNTVIHMADILTGSAIAVELMVAVAFLVPSRFFRRVRDPVLLGFCLLTYFVLPVPSFGMCLVTLGFAQTPYRVYKRIYLLAFVLMPLTATRYWMTRIPL